MEKKEYELGTNEVFGEVIVSTPALDRLIKFMENEVDTQENEAQKIIVDAFNEIKHFMQRLK